MVASGGREPGHGRIVDFDPHPVAGRQLAAKAEQGLALGVGGLLQRPIRAGHDPGLGIAAPGQDRDGMTMPPRKGGVEGRRRNESTLSSPC